MKLSYVLTLMGGLALFLYGMNMMSRGLEMTAGDKMKTILEKLTSNRFLAVFVGALITAIIQSSSATTVMVVGFVNVGLMTLSQAVWIIMGANIGTTITGQLIALDVSEIAPLFAITGVVMATFFKHRKVNSVGEIIAGLGILFMGMDLMSTAMMPLRESEAFIGLMTNFQNPILGILAGAIFTAIIQSSSASVGILQALAISGVIQLSSAVYVLFGQNIGTCITAVLASIGTNRNAKRTTIIHLLFNIIGTIIFVIICMTTSFTSFVESLTPTNVAAQIANVHTIFNIATTIVLLPFGYKLADLAYKILPDVKEEKKDQMHLQYLNTVNTEYHIGTTTIMFSQLFKEIQRMLEFAKNNVDISYELVSTYDSSKYDLVMKNEQYIDYMNKEIVKYISNVVALELPIDDSKRISQYFKIVGDLERIGDHATNVASQAKQIHQNGKGFSKEASQEVEEMKLMSKNILELLEIHEDTDIEAMLKKVADLEEEMDQKTRLYSLNQLIRLKSKSCTLENSALFTDMLSDFERIGDHGLNIANAFCQIKAHIN